jgi:carbonic anhydrase/acetyltransferase-like protein (isoleucine patch superfamily)
MGHNCLLHGCSIKDDRMMMMLTLEVEKVL